VSSFPYPSTNYGPPFGHLVYCKVSNYPAIDFYHQPCFSDFLLSMLEIYQVYHHYFTNN